MDVVLCTELLVSSVDQSSVNKLREKKDVLVDTDRESDKSENSHRLTDPIDLKKKDPELSSVQGTVQKKVKSYASAVQKTCT